MLVDNKEKMKFNFCFTSAFTRKIISMLKKNEMGEVDTEISEIIYLPALDEFKSLTRLKPGNSEVWQAKPLNSYQWTLNRREGVFEDKLSKGK